MKNIITLLLASLLCLTLAACGNDTTPNIDENAGVGRETAADAAGTVENNEDPAAGNETDAATEPATEAATEANADWPLSLPVPSFTFKAHDACNADINGTADEILAYIDELKNSGLKYNSVSENDSTIVFSGYDGTGTRVVLRFFKDGSDQSYISSEYLETAGGFGIGWAANDFEKLIPEPPFNGMVKGQIEGNTYTIEVQGTLDTTGKDRTNLLDYFRILCSYGFHVETTGTVEGADGQPWDYEWLVTDGLGNSVEFKMDSGWCWITFTMGS
ncbi:MAG: hypothetical protein E7658_10000 [Ruminococcaceae bacterium]|nr:hypothetical protein [Oscillospiraceae bacterium]